MLQRTRNPKKKQVVKKEEKDEIDDEDIDRQIKELAAKLGLEVDEDMHIGIPKQRSPVPEEESKQDALSDLVITKDVAPVTGTSQPTAWRLVSGRISGTLKSLAGGVMQISLNMAATSAIVMLTGGTGIAVTLGSSMVVNILYTAPKLARKALFSDEGLSTSDIKDAAWKIGTDALTMGSGLFIGQIVQPYAGIIVGEISSGVVSGLIGAAASPGALTVATGARGDAKSIQEELKHEQQAENIMEGAIASAEEEDIKEIGGRTDEHKFAWLKKNAYTILKGLTVSAMAAYALAVDRQDAGRRLFKGISSLYKNKLWFKVAVNQQLAALLPTEKLADLMTVATDAILTKAGIKDIKLIPRFIRDRLASRVQNQVLLQLTIGELVRRINKSTVSVGTTYGLQLAADRASEWKSLDDARRDLQAFQTELVSRMENMVSVAGEYSPKQVFKYLMDGLRWDPVQLHKEAVERAHDRLAKRRLKSDAALRNFNDQTQTQAAAWDHATRNKVGWLPVEDVKMAETKNDERVRYNGWVFHGADLAFDLTLGKVARLGQLARWVSKAKLIKGMYKYQVALGELQSLSSTGEFMEATVFHRILDVVDKIDLIRPSVLIEKLSGKDLSYDRNAAAAGVFLRTVAGTSATTSFANSAFGEEIAYMMGLGGRDSLGDVASGRYFVMLSGAKKNKKKNILLSGADCGYGRCDYILRDGSRCPHMAKWQTYKDYKHGAVVEHRCDEHLNKESANTEQRRRDRDYAKSLTRPRIV